ncbi:hypothetical protein [Hyphococcus sp.]|jgi:hypothetical protein|uniref:hypothetical protein n=1 Tax=Hyphococcus sp. TaxID=2038636 RepID=UPI003D1244C4
MTENDQTIPVEDEPVKTPLDYLRYMPIDLSMYPPDDVVVEAICIALSAHPDTYVRGNAILGFGHLSRTLRKLDEKMVKPIIEAALHDKEAFVRGQADCAMDDIENFLGWKFNRKRPRVSIPAPRSIITKAVYCVCLVLDEESNILVERHDLPGVAAPSDRFAPDPRGLSHGYEWRLPGYSMMRDPPPRAKKLEELWMARRKKVWLNVSNEFNESAIVQALTLEGAVDHKYLDWLEIICCAYLCDRADNVWPPEEGLAQKWLTEEQFMAGFPVGAHDRYVYALFREFMTDQ